MVEVNRTLSHLTELNAAINAMIEEVEHLRGERALDNDALARAWDEGRDMERAAVVAYLRACDGESYDFADAIERGEHRREEAP
jgi:hypothetical protein